MFWQRIQDRKIAIFQGHDTVADEPDWTGTIYDYWAANEVLSLSNIVEMMDDLDADGFHQIGGGAMGCFTIREVKDTLQEEPNENGCTSPGGHEWAYTGTVYGGDDESYFGEGRCYCIHCGADGDA